MERYRVLGIVGAVIAYPFIAVSILLTPWFNFYNNALSDLGNVARNAPVAYVFNTGLFLSGFLVASFALVYSLKNRSWRCLSWSTLLVLTGVDLALIGVFPEDVGRLHGIVSVVFFSMIIIVMLVYGFSSIISKSYLTGLLAFISSIASATIWVVKWDWQGVAIQETLTSLIATIWLLIVSLQTRKRVSCLQPVE